MTYTKANVLKPGDNKGAGGNKKIPSFSLTWMISRYSLIVRQWRLWSQITWYWISGLIWSNFIQPWQQLSEVIPLKVIRMQKGLFTTWSSTIRDRPSAIREFKANWIFRKHGCTGAEMWRYYHMIFTEHHAHPWEMVVKWDDTKDKKHPCFYFENHLKCQLPVGSYQGSVTFWYRHGHHSSQYHSIRSCSRTRHVSVDRWNTDSSNHYYASLALLIKGSIPSWIRWPSSFDHHLCNDFVFVGGVSWNALSGSMITFKAINTGGSTWKFCEQSRV